MIRSHALLLVLALAGTASLPAGAQGQLPPPTRGELLYSNHCIACHATQMHWREKRQATNWASLRAQVQHWQGVARLDWAEEDILDVVRHLNDTIYKFTPPPDPRG